MSFGREGSSDPAPPASTHTAFVAGATGFTGRALARQDAGRFGADLRLQVRPGSSSRAALADDPRVVEVGLDDPAALEGAIEGCDTVVQLVGTVRARFDEKTSYESVDYGTTVALLAAARRCRVDHFVLLSSVGAGTGAGSYLQWKKKTEQAVKDSGLGYTILRPSYLAGDEVMTERRPATFSSAFLGGMADTPFGAPFANLRPINIQVLARIILEVVRRGPRDRVLVGNGLFRIARELGDLPPSALEALED